MASRINVRGILNNLVAGLSQNQIVKRLKVPKHSVKAVVERFKELGMDIPYLNSLSDDELYKLFFPDKMASQDIYERPDLEYMQKELKRPHVTLYLLWEEYRDECKKTGKLYVSYSTLSREYTKYIGTTGFANHIYHKPGERVEVDWAGSTMSYVDGRTGKKHTVYLFVGDLVCSRLAYVRPCLSMDEENWIRCHIEMFKYFGGVPKTIICDNLRTGVAAHPKLGEVAITPEYEAMMFHYGTAILPAEIKAPRQKSSTEGTVGNIETGIVVALRDTEFYSFEALKKAVAARLEEHNNAEFTKRTGSRWQYYEDNERECMQPLPAMPFEVGRWVYERTVQSNSHIAFEKNFYSVPYTCLGQKVNLKITDCTVNIYSKNSLIKSHPRFIGYATNRYSTDPADMPPGAVSTTVNADTYRKWAAGCGPNTSTAIERILSSKPIVEQTFNSAKAVLMLSKHFTRQRLENACRIALSRAACPRYNQIKAILDSQQDKGKDTPKDEDKRTSGILREAGYYMSSSKTSGTTEEENK